MTTMGSIHVLTSSLKHPKGISSPKITELNNLVILARIQKISKKPDMYDHEVI